LADAALINLVDPGWTQLPFLLPSGNAVCLCVERGPPLTGPNILHVVAHDLDGTVRRDEMIEGWSGRDAHQGYLVDAALAADGLTAVVAVAYLDRQVWSVRLDLIELLGGGTAPRLVASETVSRTPASAVEDGALRSVRVWLSPDGQLARVQTSGARDDLIAP